ncbi:MAG: hypothetical protein AB1611_12005 [bacterium]
MNRMKFSLVFVLGLFLLLVLFPADSPLRAYYGGSVYGGGGYYGLNWPYVSTGYGFGAYPYTNGGSGTWGNSLWLSPYSAYPAYSYSPYQSNFSYYSPVQSPFSWYTGGYTGGYTGAYTSPTISLFPFSQAGWGASLTPSWGVSSWLSPAGTGNDGGVYSPFDYCQITDQNSPAPAIYRKPAIYLYPLKDTQVSVKLDVAGEITKTIPPYHDGWCVLATADGTITDEKQGKHYDYLFWEANTDLNALELPDEGWVVARPDLEAWFNKYLPKLGLNRKEKEQFMEYWLDQLQGSSYYEMKLLSSSFLAEHARLTITPAPDTLIRVIFHFTPLNEYRELAAPAIETPDRKGFVVLEWGGILREGEGAIS